MVSVADNATTIVATAAAATAIAETPAAAPAAPMAADDPAAPIPLAALLCAKDGALSDKTKVKAAKI